MKRKITINQSPELEIKLRDKVYNVVFSNSLLIQYTEKYGELGAKSNTCDFFSKLLHSYFDFVGEDVSLSECRVLILRGGDEIIEVMTECLIDAVSMSNNEEIKKKVHLIKAQMKTRNL